MKIRKFIAVFVIAAMLLAAAVPAFAGQRPSGMSVADRAKLAEFWQYVSPETGMSNGNAVYDINLPPYATMHFGGSYGGDWNTALVQVGEQSTFDGLVFSFPVQYYAHDDEYSWEGTIIVEPDLYGTLDLSGTDMLFLNTPAVGQTHISGVVLNDCEYLETIAFSGQEFCTSLIAENCHSLNSVNAINCNYRYVSIQPEGFASPLAVAVIGEGNIGVEYAEGSFRLIASQSERFLGWFSDGQCISTENELLTGECGKVYACFAGDVDGNGIISVADSTLILRQAIGLSECSDIAASDANANGTIEVSDAVAILRIAMGT